MLHSSPKDLTSFRDQVSSAASSDTGSEYIVSDSDMEPEPLESETKDPGGPQAKKKDALRWFQATKSEQLACTYILSSICSFSCCFLTVRQRFCHPAAWIL